MSQHGTRSNEDHKSTFCNLLTKKIKAGTTINRLHSPHEQTKNTADICDTATVRIFLYTGTPPFVIIAPELEKNPRSNHWRSIKIGNPHIGLLGASGFCINMCTNFREGKYWTKPTKTLCIENTYVWISDQMHELIKAEPCVAARFESRAMKLVTGQPFDTHTQMLFDLLFGTMLWDGSTNRSILNCDESTTWYHNNNSNNNTWTAAHTLPMIDFSH